jgi:hypothetical protein
MGEADMSGLEGGDTGRQAVDLLAGGHRPGGGVPGHVAVVTDPVDRVTEPWASYSSVAAKTAASKAKPSSKRSKP